MNLDLFHPANHQRLTEYLVRNAPDPGHIPAWIMSAEDFLRANQFVLPTVKVLRRLILSARSQVMEADEYYRKHRRMVTRVIRAFRLMSDIHLYEKLSPFEKVARIEEGLPLEKLRAIRDETDIINVPRGSEKLYFASRSYQTLEKYLPQTP